MPVTNLMKDIVINILDEVLKKEKVKNINGNGRDDIIAYVLNRVQPKYVTSERGLLYGILDAKYQVQQRVDILFLIYEAIYQIQNRRDSNNAVKETVIPEKNSYLPHIVGQVLEDSSLSIVPDVEVMLMYGGMAAPMVDSDWDNPYTTIGATKGHFHFWPKYEEKEMGKGPHIPFSIIFKHDKYTAETIDLSLEVVRNVDFGRSLFIPIVLMKAKEGVEQDAAARQ
jgi:competence protein ComFB